MKHILNALTSDGGDNVIMLFAICIAVFFLGFAAGRVGSLDDLTVSHVYCGR